MIIKISLEHNDRHFAIGVDSTSFKGDDTFNRAIIAMCSALEFTVKELQQGRDPQRFHSPYIHEPAL